MDGDLACLETICEEREEGWWLTRIMLQESFHSLLNLLKEVLCCLQWNPKAPPPSTCKMESECMQPSRCQQRASEVDMIDNARHLTCQQDATCHQRTFTRLTVMPKNKQKKVKTTLRGKLSSAPGLDLCCDGITVYCQEWDVIKV